MKKISIDEVITEAANSKSDKDYLLFFELAQNMEFFFNYNESGEQMTIPMVAVGDNKRAVIFYSSKEAAGRHGKYAGIPWERGLEMISRMPAVDGLVIQNCKNSWIAMTREKIIELMTH